MTRESFFVRARRIKAEVEQIFRDAAYWNQYVRAPDQEPIDPDPDGALLSLIAYCDGILNGDVYIAPERPTP